jgi:ribosomal protein S27AE
MENFRHNLSPVEVKRFLKLLEGYDDYLVVMYCMKSNRVCPQCGNGDTCRGAAVGAFSSRFDKITHELQVCLHCGYKHVANVLTVERM